MKQIADKQTGGPLLLFTTATCLLVGALLVACANGAGAMSFDQQELQQQQLAATAAAAGKTGLSLAVIESPELVARVLESLLRSVVYSSSVDQLQTNPQKRGLDLGISRGFSGSQAGKHLMGLSAASFANGPGRR